MTTTTAITRGHMMSRGSLSNKIRLKYSALLFDIFPSFYHLIYLQNQVVSREVLKFLNGISNSYLCISIYFLPDFAVQIVRL